MPELPDVVESSGNVFADLGLPDADIMLFKSRIVLAIGEAIRARGLSQTRAAAITGIAQPDLSNLMRGRSRGFSTDRLFRALKALGADVEVRITQPAGAEPGHEGELKVLVA